MNQASKPHISALLSTPSVGIEPQATQPLPSYFTADTLDFQSRVWAQTQIERVYYSHRIWPKDNPGPKPSFEAAVPAALLEKKAADTLRMTAALRENWNLEITPAMLQSELERMERESRDRAMLHELCAALNNDPFLIAETLARANVADRLLRDRFDEGGGSRRGMQHQFDDWRAEKLRDLAGDEFPAVARSGEFRLPQTPTSPAAGCDVWDGRIKDNIIPDARAGHTAAWTGSEMIVWGGYQSDNGTSHNTGGRYTPATDSWVVMATGPTTPGPRHWHTAVWTGTEMIIWGGYDGYGPGSMNSGGRYNPVTGNWTTTSSGANVPSARFGHTAIWTGSEMIIWGGGSFNTLNTGGRYSPGGDSWTATSTGANVPAGRSDHGAVWTGSVMIVWGGQDSGGNGLSSGGRYSPAGDSWTATSTGANLPAGRYRHSAIWTGSVMIVWGGLATFGSPLGGGGRYNPVGDTWSTLSTGANAPFPRYAHTAVWSGSAMIVWGGTDDTSYFNSGGRYTPGTDSWIATSGGANVPVGRSDHSAVWTGSEMIVWGGTDINYYPVKSGGRYNPATDVWTPTYTGAAVPNARSMASTVWTGAEMIVWGGFNGRANNTGGRYNPATNVWTATSTGGNAPSFRTGHSAVWTGSEMIIWGGGSGGFMSFNDGSSYNPVSDSWIRTSTGTNVPIGRNGHTAVWSGTEMIVWGGGSCFPSCASFNTGGRYNPATDSWLPTSTGAGVPAARSTHIAVWTGTLMIVWGGNLNTGGRYNPGNDTWSATSTGANVPSARYGHPAVWTGTEMIIWGGASGGAAINTGGRYNPGGDIWTATSTGANIPTGRDGHSAVWTGSEMIVWGGGDDIGTLFNSGGRYSPGANSWSAVSSSGAVPAPRSGHSAVWSGTDMIVWGGADNLAGFFNTGGLYSLAAPGAVGNTVRGGKSATVNLSWVAGAGATTYNVKRCAAAGAPCVPSAVVATPTAPNYSEPFNATTYYYAIEAVNGCGVTP